MMRRLYQPIIRNKPDGTSIQKVIVAESAKLITALDTHLDQEVYLNPLLLFFTRNVFLQLVLSKSWSFDTENEEEKEFTASTYAMLENLTSIADYIPTLDFLATKSRKIAVQSVRKIDAYLKREITLRENEKISEENPRDLVDLLIIELKKNPELTEEALLYTFHDVLFAGTITTADTLEWMLLYLCKFPELQEKCYTEISEKLQGKQPSLDDQQKLPYLDAVIKETLRLRPAAPLSLPHRADEDCTIAGFNVEKGTLVMQNLYGIGNSEKYFKNATEFDPDRWARDPDAASNLLSFGYGPTSCLGMSLAKQELFLAAASMFQRFKFKIGPSTPSPDFTGGMDLFLYSYYCFMFGFPLIMHLFFFFFLFFSFACLPFFLFSPPRSYSFSFLLFFFLRTDFLYSSRI
eukprot:Phypoly_transcript_07669.p1 GENE.Phypoly_transcript_07669~~Phypoly_transcript_07669.p1  ORF type:complete len:406 (+),score=54.98 Phypoly_transcript_07669:282-1499(+)